MTSQTKSAGLGRFWRVAGLAVIALACAGAIYAVGPVSRQARLAELGIEAGRAATLAVAVLRSEVEKQRGIPLVLSQDTDIRSALQSHDPAALSAIDMRLEDLAAQTRSSVIYLVDVDGVAVAASNYRLPESFVGSDYRFRHYFGAAMANGSAEQYGLGTVSLKPGLYLSRRVEGPDGPLGVVVVKVELNDVEAAWRQSGRPTFIDDGRSVVLATSVPQWRFQALAPIAPADAAAIRDSIQYAEAGLVPLAIDKPSGTAGEAGGLVRVDAGQGREGYVEAMMPVDAGPPGWRLHLLVPADRDLARTTFYWRSVTALSLALAAGALLFLLRWRHWQHQRQRDLARTARELEVRVGERTVALSAANEALVGQIAERENAEARVLKLRDELAQANRLASLGQITAGVAHEINQPLSAIRTFAENALRFIDRADTPQARGNLSTIVDLTQTIGTITGTLRNFARRQPGERRPLDVAEPLDGALTMLRSRIRDQGIGLAMPDRVQPAMVVGNKTRLEQVFVNILRNAMDALAGQADGRIAIAIEVRNGRVWVTFADNGPGFSADMLERLFTPFSTTRSEGLGLGLVISADIVRELGGTLDAGNGPGGGAVLRIDMPEATP